MCKINFEMSLALIELNGDNTFMNVLLTFNQINTSVNSKINLIHFCKYYYLRYKTVNVVRSVAISQIKEA